MMKSVLTSVDRAPLYWIALSIGLLTFALNLLFFSEPMATQATEQSLLDDAFVERLRAGDPSYELVPETPQTFGSHVLPHYLTAWVSHLTGDADRAGVWLSLVGVTGVLTGLYILAIRIHAHRGFALATVLAAGALGPLHDAVSPTPSTALGMALVVWGMAFFLTALTERKPHDIFASAILFGLASYIRIEFAFMWMVLGVYLILLHILHGKARRTEPSAFAMALGGLFTLAIVLWPLVNRNIGLANTPLLPGHDAELILGAPGMLGDQMATPYVERLLQGVSQLTLSSSGPGIFAGILLPVGLVIGLFLGRQAKVPFFWIPVLLVSLGGMTALSWITGQESYLETLGILAPVLLPFSLLPLAFVLERVLQSTPRSAAFCRLAWAGTAAVFFLLVQIPNFFPSEQQTADPSSTTVLVQQFSELPMQVKASVLLSDQPGLFVRAGKENVIGTRGQTDWSILATSTSTGGFLTDDLLAYLKDREVGLIHLSDPDNPLLDQLELETNAPDFETIKGLSPPHRLVSISWP